MAGFEVSRGLLDQKVAEMVLSLRDAYRKVEPVAAYLTAHPNKPLPEGQTEHTAETEPLMAEPFGYTAAEAYLIRVTAEDLEYNRLQIQGALNRGRGLTGLE